MTACNACASRSAAFTMRNPTPGKSAASSPSKDCAASPSSTQGTMVATCDQKRANRTRQISSGTVTAPPPSPPCTDTPLRMHLTIHRTGEARRAGDVRGDGNSPQAMPCAPTGRLSWSVYRDRRERLSGTGSPLSPQRQRSSSRRSSVPRLPLKLLMRRSFALSAAQVLAQRLGDEVLYHAAPVGAHQAHTLPEGARDACDELGEWFRPAAAMDR